MKKSFWWICIMGDKTLSPTTSVLTLSLRTKLPLREEQCYKHTIKANIYTVKLIILVINRWKTRLFINWCPKVVYKWENLCNVKSSSIYIIHLSICGFLSYLLFSNLCLLHTTFMHTLICIRMPINHYVNWRIATFLHTLSCTRMMECWDLQVGHSVVSTILS